MGLKGALATAAIRILGEHTNMLARLDQRRKFESFVRQHKDIKMLEFDQEERIVFYRHIHDNFVGDQPIAFLEFGVFEGASIRAWSELNTNPQSIFVGFDTFEGLPEYWAEDYHAGAFSTQGRIPAMGDPRVSFVRGLFQDTLPAFLSGFAPAGRLVLHLDADLYSSTLYVLAKIDPPRGTIVLFDEFRTPLHEFRAFEDWRAAFRRAFRPLAARTDFAKLAIELL